jgi:archaellum component FlaC/DNA-binding transcriptional ArsR family regulator
MAGKPSDATTSIDSLAELLKSRGKMELSKIAQTLGVEQNIVENWAKVLEEGNLVRITYEVGKMYVESMTVTKDQESALIATVEAQKVKLENDLALQRTSLERYSARLEALGLSVKSAESLFAQKFPELETQLTGINKIYTALEGENSRIDAIKKDAESTYEGVNKKIASLYGRVEGVDTNTVQTAKDELVKIQGILKKATELETQIDQLSKSKDRALETIRKSIEDQLKSLEKELQNANRNIAVQLKGDSDQIKLSLKSIREQANSIDDLSKQVNSFRRDKEAVKKALNESKSTFNDEYSRISTRMDTTGAALRTQINAMLRELDTLKANFGELDKVYDTLQKSKNEIDSLEKRISDLRIEADKVAEEMRDLNTMKGSTESKSRATQKVLGQVTKISEEGKQIDNEIEKIDKGISSEDE